LERILEKPMINTIKVDIPKEVNLEDAINFYNVFLDTEIDPQTNLCSHYHLEINHDPLIPADPVSIYSYIKGKTPRLEIRVDEVEEWEGSSTHLGCKVIGRIYSKENPTEIIYLQVIDIYGHLWSFSKNRLKPTH